jgi:hypothetical protein
MLVDGTPAPRRLSVVVAVWSSHRIIAATLAALGSAGVLAACDRNKPATEVPAAAPPAARVRVPDGIEPLTTAQEAERDLAAPSEDELQLLLDSSADEFPTLREGACGGDASCASESTCGACGVVADSGS